MKMAFVCLTKALNLNLVIKKIRKIQNEGPSTK